MKNENFLHQVAKADAELFHSNMLAFLWKKYPKLANVAFTNKFIGEDDDVTADGLTREKFHIDILLRTSGKVVAIENKLKSRHTADQLNGYFQDLQVHHRKESIRLIGLTPTSLDAKETAERLNLDGDHFSFISFEDHVVPFLRKALDLAKIDGDPSAAFYVSDYLDIVEHLVSQCKKYEESTETFGSALQGINTDIDLRELRLVPLMQLQVFERVHASLQKILASSPNGNSFDLGAVGIASKSIQGQITLALNERRKAEIEGKWFTIGFGLQLEGTRLRRSMVFEKDDGTAIDANEKDLIHEIATLWQVEGKYFCTSPDEISDAPRARHFPERGDRYSLLAYKNSPTAFYVYRNLRDEKITKLTLEEVALLLATELNRLLSLVVSYHPSPIADQQSMDANLTPVQSCSS